MNTLTGSYDIVVQLREDALGRIIGSMHRAGVIAHTFLRVHDDRRIELQIGRPKLSLLTSGTPGGPSRALAAIRIGYSSRSLSDVSDIGVYAVADVAVRVRVDTPAPPAGVAESVEIVIDWQETLPGDITVLDRTGPDAIAIRTAMLETIREVGIRFHLPALPDDEVFPPLASVGVRFLSSASTRFLAVGLHLQGTPAGASAPLQSGFLTKDFAIAIDESRVIRAIREALRAQFGSLPPRYASAPELADCPAIRIEYSHRGDGNLIDEVSGRDEWGQPWALSARAAVDLLEEGRCTFFTEEPDGHKVAVKVVHGLGRPYLRSSHDDGHQNNLHALPKDPEYFAPAPGLPVVLSDQRICTLPNPLGGCLEESRQRVFLESLDIALEQGTVLFSGQVTQRTDAVYVPDITASFALRAVITLGTEGTVMATVLQPEIHLQQWYAQLFNVLTFDGVARAVRDGLRQALESSANGGALSGVFSTEVLRLLTTFGGQGTVNATPVPTSIEVRPEAVILHGKITVTGTTAVPKSRFSILQLPATPTRVVFHAGASWAPGADISRYDWSFGDGTSAESSGAAATFMCEHDYGPGGPYRACLKVTDSAGRTAERCVMVTTEQP